MTITRYAPNTVFLGGDRTQVNDVAASELIRPGQLIERFNNAGVQRWRKHSTAAAGGAAAVATNQSMLNLGIDDDYGVGDLVEASILHKGATAWMLLGTGQTVVFGDKLESAGNGTLVKAAAGVPMFVALEAITTTASVGRIRVEAL